MEDYITPKPEKLFCVYVKFCFGLLFVLLMGIKNKTLVRSCPQTVGRLKSVLDLCPEFIHSSLSICNSEENRFDIEWGKLGKFCCHLFKIKFEQVLICFFNDLVHCVCLYIQLYGLLL